MRIETLCCWRCGTTVRGQLTVPILARLPDELARFVETFLASNGSLSEVQKRLACSYPKARRLMNDTMATLRVEFEAAVREKDQILEALEAEALAPREAARLLNSLTGSNADE